MTLGSPSTQLCTEIQVEIRRRPQGNGIQDGGWRSHSPACLGTEVWWVSSAKATLEVESVN